MTEQTTAPAAPQTEQPNEYTGFSYGAIALIVGSLIALAAYPLTWWVVTDDPEAGVTGFGQVKETATTMVTFESSKAHWGALAGAVVFLIIAGARLLGKYNHEWNRALIAGAIAMVVGAGFAYLGGAGFSVSTGVYVVTLGAVVSLVGAVLVYLKR